MQITNEMLDAWDYAFPDVNVAEEIRIMDLWLYRHPKRRMTLRFIENWLKKAQRQSSGVRKEARVGMGPRL